MREFVEAVWPASTKGEIVEAGRLADPLEAWVLLPADPVEIGNFAFVALVVCAILLTRVRGWIRTALLVPVLYLTAFVWENRLVTEPSVTRLLLLGALLVVLMNVRPQGLFGKPRVEVV